MDMNTPLQMILMMFAGWVNEHQRAVIAYLQEENRVLREVHGRKRLRFNDDQRRRLAAKGRALGRRLLCDIGSVVTPYSTPFCRILETSRRSVFIFRMVVGIPRKACSNPTEKSGDSLSLPWIIQ